MGFRAHAGPHHHTWSLVLGASVSSLSSLSCHSTKHQVLVSLDRAGDHAETNSKSMDQHEEQAITTTITVAIAMQSHE